jgi:sulfate adenylyltransferase (ADP) / ATP adenylyltransferase
MGEMNQPQWEQPLSLWERTVAQTRYALQTGALQPIPTEYELIEQGGITFLVRISVNLVRKPAPQPSQSQTRPINPFLPYDSDLFVANLSPTHLCLLNKYNVTDYHLLIITRAFEPQESLLTLADFEALWRCLSEIDGLGFYNSGKLAGASQPHKHLQLVPLPLSEAGSEAGSGAGSGAGIPVEAVLKAAVWQEGIGQTPLLPFQHALMRLEADPKQVDLNQAAQLTQTAYQTLMHRLNFADGQPYNLLVTRQWILLIPRQQEQFESIPVNALGFAGTLFVRNSAQLEQLKAIGPLTLLKQVAVSPSG